MPNQKRACTDEARGEYSEFTSIASEFRRLSKRFEEYRQQDARAAHLSVNLGESKVRAGRVLVAAIDAGAFPKSMSEQNGEWWDRTIGRLPGGVFTIFRDGFRWRKGEPSPEESPEFVAAASKPLDPAQLARCWTFAIGSWLVPEFPCRFRHNAAGKDWEHVLGDRETGRPVDKDGKVLRGRWFKDGKPMPYDFQHTPDLRDGNYEWKLQGEPAMVHEKYDEADLLHLLQARAEVYAEACLQLADLVEPSSDPGPHVLQIPGDLITQERACEILACCAKTVERRIDDGTVRGYGPRGRRKVSQAEIESKRPQMLDRKPRRRNRSSRTANSKGTQ